MVPGVCWGYFPPRGHPCSILWSWGAWPDGEGLVRAVTVYNRSSLPLDRVEVVPDGAIEPGSLRIEGRPAEEPVLPGLAAGGQALLTWREPASGTAQAIGLRYRYTFAGEVREGVCTL